MKKRYLFKTLNVKAKICAISLLLLFASPAFFGIGQNQLSKTGFFKSLQLDPVITLHNKSASAIECITISYKIDGVELQPFKFGGTLPANTSVDIPLPRFQVSGGMHFFDASVATISGQPLKNITFAEGLSFTLSPGEKISSGKISKKTNSTVETSTKTDCSCENGKGFDEDISFWFSVYLDDSHKLDAFASTSGGKKWFPGKWGQKAGLENELNQVSFSDPARPNRNFVLNISTAPVPENILSYATATGPDGNATGPETFSPVAFPNPFSRNVSIQYTLVRDQKVDLVITDLNGKVVSNPIRPVQQGRGVYTQELDLQKLVAGVYYLIIQAGSNKKTIKLVKE